MIVEIARQRAVRVSGPRSVGRERDWRWTEGAGLLVEDDDFVEAEEQLSISDDRGEAPAGCQESGVGPSRLPGEIGDGAANGR